jgi:integrase
VSVSKLPSGRYRAQVWSQGRWVSAHSIIGGERSYKNPTEAKKAKREAQVALEARRGTGTMTLQAFADRWTTDPLFSRPKESTNLHNAERIGGFVGKYGRVGLANVSDQHVQEWLAGGKNLTTVPALRAMFNDAMSAKAGRLVDRNPFAGLGISKGRGNRDAQPPSEKQAWELIYAARRLSLPSFAAWLQVACFTGMRPGELDALKWDRVDFENGVIQVAEQFNAKSRSFTLPKNGQRRDALLTTPAREALLSLPRESEFCFVNSRGQHWTTPARAYHWQAVRSATDWTGSTYLGTRHFFGWFAINVLHLDSEDVALIMGHTDGGELVRKLYGHRDKRMAFQRARNAFEGRENVRPLPQAREETA